MLRSTPVCVAIYFTFARSALCTIVSGLSLSLVCVCGPLISQFLKAQRTHTKQTHTNQTQTKARREYQNVPNPPTSPNRLLPTPKTPPDYIFIAHPSRPKRTSSTLLLTSHQHPPIYLPYPIPATAHAAPIGMAGLTARSCRMLRTHPSSAFPRPCRPKGWHQVALPSEHWHSVSCAVGRSKVVGLTHELHPPSAERGFNVNTLPADLGPFGPGVDTLEEVLIHQVLKQLRRC